MYIGVSGQKVKVDDFYIEFIILCIHEGIRGTGSLIHFIEAIGFPKPALEQEGEEVREGVELSVESDVPVA